MNRPLAELDDSLKILHYYITRVYFLRTDSLNIILPHDCWIMSHVVSDMSLNYPHLLFGAIVDAAANESPAAGLPFAGLVTQLLHRVGFPLTGLVLATSDFVSPTLDDVLGAVELPLLIDLTSGGEASVDVPNGFNGEGTAEGGTSAEIDASASTSIRPFKLKRQAKGPRPSKRMLKRLKEQNASKGVVMYENQDLDQNN
ncbi:unnamed protein product [Linum trigynum]|uniref:Uncharacterized protein n=2 Tax=Linum trigynum TaxID=586398 RepID=A0AAV2F523_9ROSI